MPLQKLVEISDVASEATIFAPTGGNRVDREVLIDLQSGVRELAAESGYPADSSQESRGNFDAASAQFLRDRMGISAAEASSQGMWAFVACVMLPDVVRWRFPGSKETTVERFLGGTRGIRNTFGRVWWRAHIMRLANNPDPYRLLRELGEDELVQIMERPNLAGNMMLAQLTAEIFLEALPELPFNVPRSELLRDAMKRIRRLFPVMAFDAMDSEMLKEQLETVFADSVERLSS